MSVLKPNDLMRLIKAPRELAKALLLHGPDEGHVGELAGQAATALAGLHEPPGEILRLDDQDLADDPDRPIVEVRTMPMFGGPVVLRIKAGARLKAEVVDALLEPGMIAGGVVVEAGNLKKDAKLRKQFESAKNAAAVACYPDNAGDLARLADDVLGAAGISLGREARDHLVELIGADRALSRNELEKLALYGLGQKELSWEDVDLVVGDSATQAIDRVVLAAADGNAALATHELDRALAAGEQAQTLILGLQRHFARLHALQAAVADGKPVDLVMRSARPPIHFAAKAQISRQVQRWKPARLEHAIVLTQRAIAGCRRASGTDAMLASMLFIEIARLSR